VTDRGVAPVVGKSLELAVTVILVGLLAGALYGGLLPQYRTATGAELADRTLSTAATQVETAASRVDVAANANATRASATVTVRLPGTIRGEAYRIRAVENASLALVHPHPAVGGRIRLVLPSEKTRVSGVVRSGDRATVTVRARSGTQRIVLGGAS
jgi:type II secretory pathway pseudopilin PulG